MEIIAIFIPIIFMLVMGAVIIYAIYSSNKTKLTLIDKGLVDENIKYLFNHDNNDNTSVRYRLKYFRFGIIILFFGLGLLFGFIAEHLWMREEFMAPSIIIAIGLGFIIYHFVEMNMKNKIDEKSSDEK